MYTWGYLKNVTLAKLDLSESEAENQNLINSFRYYANEAINQICSTVKPNHTFAQFNAVTKSYIESKYGPVEDDSYEEVAAQQGLVLIGTQCRMPLDFIGFGDDVNERTYREYDTIFTEAATDEDFRYVGYNKVLFKKPGTYLISYKARWVDFSASEVDDSDEIDAPSDVLDCIPSYIASQCYKIDDLTRAQIFRNEYEMLLARVEDSNYKNTKTFKIGGDW